MRVRRAVPVAGLAVVVFAAAALGQSPSRSVVASDDSADVAPGALDLTRFAVRRYSRGRARASLTLAAGWRAGQLRARSGPPGSLCVKVWTVSDPPDETPDYLVCATVRADGQRLRGSVLRVRPNQLPERVAGAKVTRPSAKTLRLFFAQSAIGSPSAIDTAAETTAAGCMRAACRDTAPNAPRTIRLRLRKPARVGPQALREPV